MKASLKDGYTVEIPDNVTNDWGFLTVLRKIDKGESSMVVDAAEILLGGPEEVEKLAEHLKGEDGRTTIDSMVNAVTELLLSVSALKN